MRILILNWRCPSNPKAGGAEIVTYEIARRLVAQGHEIEWFAAAFPGGAKAEDLNGIRVLRAGRQWTVHWAAFRHYWRKLRGRFDVVIDQVNTIPFFTPLWADIPSFMFIHQLAREVWWYETPFPINALGYLAEPIYLRCYHNRPVLTVSRSTRDDLRRLGLKGPITIVPEGLESAPSSNHQKAATFTFLYVGRMARSKRVADIIRAFALVQHAGTRSQLWLVGEGDKSYQKELRSLACSYKLQEEVCFLGRVSTSEKYRRMAEAHVLVMASVREGWGLVVLEANACGTPSVAYDVAGLRDAVRHGETGLLVRPYPERLAEGMIRLAEDPELYERLAAAARAWSTQFSFDAAAAVVGKGLLGQEWPAAG